MNEGERPEDSPIPQLLLQDQSETAIAPAPEKTESDVVSEATDHECPADETATEAAEPRFNGLFPEPVDSAPDESPAPAYGSAEILDALSRLGHEMNGRLTNLQSLFEREIRAEGTRERIVDRLHSELQEYKQDLLLKVQKPIFLDLIQLHDDIGKMIEARTSESSEGVVNEAIGMLDSIRTGIEDALYRQGVEPFRSDTDEFDPRRQRAVTTVPTDEPERNKTIAARLRPGFQSGDKLLRAEIVSVYTLKR